MIAYTANMNALSTTFATAVRQWTLHKKSCTHEHVTANFYNLAEVFAVYYFENMFVQFGCMIFFK